MKKWIIPGIIALLMLLALPGAVSAGDNVVVSGSILPPAPVAAFSATPLVGVAPLSVTFSDMSTGTIDTWKWEYNDGSGWNEFSTDQNTDYEFITAGPYDIRLTVTNAGGSDDETKTHHIAVATGREPLVTVQSGTVTGDLYVESPTTYATGITEVTKTFTLPAEAIGNVQWARLYVNTYSGSAANTFALTSTVKIDGTILGVETMDIASETNGNSYPLNDHVNKVYSDYEAQYDVTSLITSASPVINVKGEAISGKSFDGRIKGVTLVVAYNDPSSTTSIEYWVNHGGDWSSPGLGSTTFDTTSITAGVTSAVLKVRQFSSSDATTYTFNTVTKPGAGLTPNIDGFNIWTDMASAVTPGSSSTLSYAKTGGSYKTTLATLTATYTAPTAAFTATPTTIDAGQSVAFDASTSTGSITSYAWDFGDSSSGSGVTTSHTYSTAGTYTVTLTVDGPMGSDTETATIIVKEPAPVVEFSASTTTPVVGQSVTFTGSNTGGQVNTWTWDFGDGTGSGQTATHTYNTAGTYTITLTAAGPDYTDVETKTNYITVGGATIEVTIDPAGIDFGSMQAGTDSTGSTTVNVDVTYGTPWTVTASATNGGYMSTGSVNLANPFQLSNDGTNFVPLTSNVADFLTGAAGTDGSGTANVKQSIDAADAPGAYSITLTFTGSFA